MCGPCSSSRCACPHLNQSLSVVVPNVLPLECASAGGGGSLSSWSRDDGASITTRAAGSCVDEATSVGQPGVGEDIETLVKTALRVRVEIGGACGVVGVVAPSFAVSAALSPLGASARGCGRARHERRRRSSGRRPAPGNGTRVRAELALGIAEVVERVAAECVACLAASASEVLRPRDRDLEDTSILEVDDGLGAA